MTLGQMFILTASASTCAVGAYGKTSMQQGWPRGTIYASDKVPMLFVFWCSAIILGGIAANVLEGHLDAIWFLWAILAFFLGGPAITLILKQNTGPIALIAAPVLTACSCFVS